MSEEKDFQLKIVKKEETPRPVTSTIGTASSASRTNFFIQLPGPVPSESLSRRPQSASEAAPQKK